MKINRVILKHIRSHSHTVIPFERVSFIRGKNKSGKTTVAMAIEMVLAGRCAVTDEAGKGYEEVIQVGQQTGTVILECDTVTITLTLDRSTGRTLKVQTGVGTTNERIMLGKQAQEWIAENIGTPDVINATLNAWRFMRLSENEQASLLARVLLPAKLELEPEVNKWLAGSRLSVVERPSLFATIEATYKAIAAARTDVNRKLRDLKAIVEPEPTDVSDNGTVAAELAGKRRALDEEIESIARPLTSLREKLLNDETRKALELNAQLRERQPQIRLTLIAERDNLARIEDTLSHADDAVCPTCKAKLTPEASKAFFAPFRARETESKATITRLEKELKSSIDAEVGSKQLAVDTSNRQVVRDAEGQLGRLRDRLDSLSTTDTLVAKAAFEAKHAAYEKQVKERERAEVQLAELEKLLVFFGPRGIKAKLIAERLDLFTEHVNGVLDQWGYSLGFTIEPYSLRITETDPETGFVGPMLSPNQLSASESYRLGIAFSMAIAYWTNLRLLVADGADILDKDDKWTLAQAFLQSDLEQAIMTSTGIAGTFEAAGTAFYTLSKSNGVTALEVDAVTPMAEEVVTTCR